MRGDEGMVWDVRRFYDTLSSEPARLTLKNYAIRFAIYILGRL
jgi:hypothetical protein